MDQVLSIAGLTTGMVLGLFLLGTMNTPVSSIAALIGMVLGLIAVLAVYIPAATGNAVVAWPFYAPIGTITTVLMALFVNPLLKSR